MRYDHNGVCPRLLNPLFAHYQFLFTQPDRTCATQSNLNRLHCATRNKNLQEVERRQF